MFELMFLNYILDNKKIIYIDEKYFLVMKREYLFILNHYNRYGVVPDKTSFIAEFNDFDFVEVNENLDYILYRMREAYMYKELSNVLESSVDKIKGDSIEAGKYIKDVLNGLLDEVEVHNEVEYDIVKGARERGEAYKKRVESEGLLGISTGVVELDDILHGWLGEDLITIFARTNEGKSWIALFFAVMAWVQSKKILFYSGEMSREVVGYRFDTLLNHFSNTSLMQGRKDLGDDFTIDHYFSYIDDLSKQNGFYVITPKDLGDKPTVKQIEEYMDKVEADLVIIDQLTLMRDMRNGENKRIRYTNISEDLFTLSEKKQKPIIAVTQAKRDGGKKKEEKDLPPELDEIYESDGIAQNSTRVISMKVVGRILKLAIKKNRYGEKEKEVFLIWDKDRGYINPLLEEGESVEKLEEDYGF